MARLPLIAGNWKMNKTVAEALDLVESMLSDLVRISTVERVLCPPFVALAPVAERLRGTEVGLGAQHMHWEDAGAFTGEVSPLMLKDLCTYVIVGHSERRAYFAETDGTVNLRLQAAIRHGLKPILCVGETLSENESGRTVEVVRRQVNLGLSGFTSDQIRGIVIAYEPVWAIGTGKAASPEGANAVVAEVIRPAIEALAGEAEAESIRVLYGGSVKPDNAAPFFRQADIDGALVGGASLKAEDFVGIVAAAQP